MGEHSAEQEPSKKLVRRGKYCILGTKAGCSFGSKRDTENGPKVGPQKLVGRVDS